MSRLFEFSRPIVALMALLVVVGCAEPLQVTRQTVPKPKSPPPADRLLAAMVPIGQQAWFFKLSGKKDVVNEQRNSFVKLLMSLKIKDGEPTWIVPEAWHEQPGTGMRKATFVIETGSDEIDEIAEFSGNDSKLATLECSVIPLPSLDVVANVNRWRKQIGLKPLSADEVRPQKNGEGDLNEFDLADGTTVTWVNLEGNVIGGSGPPFANMAMGSGDMPAGHPETAPPTPKQNTKNATPKRKPQDSQTQGPIGPSGPQARVTLKDDSIPEMKFKVPTHWVLGPPRQFREKTWNIVKDGKATEASISSLGAAAAALPPNINRWRRQVGLPPLAASQIPGSLDPIQVDGIDGHYAVIQGASKIIFGAIVIRDNKAWFFKLFGDSQLSVNEESNFRKFLDSVEFN